MSWASRDRSITNGALDFPPRSIMTLLSFLEDAMLGIPVGLMYANAAEWGLHRYVLHGRNLGKKRGSFWSFHFHRHHRQSRQNGFRDPDYTQSLFSSWSGQSKEAVALTLLVAAHLPLAPIAPFFTATLAYSAVDYYRKHKRAHLDPQWAREHLPWHVDHHMALNQDANWCVTRPWMDNLMGTREPYIGTDKERKRTASAA